ncbi:hypothetical protein O3P69_005148 [Scylla paramamosain]|uniref:Uncharacterized protein n=1 Tax=Scylla paramamosain TaxID=85552 RepID=A0AAW0UA93_SCYPA
MRTFACTLKKAWDTTAWTELAFKGFVKSGIYPFNPEIVLNSDKLKPSCSFSSADPVNSPNSPSSGTTVLPACTPTTSTTLPSASQVAECKFLRPEQGIPTPSAFSNIFELIKFNLSLGEEIALKFMKQYKELYDMEDPLYEEWKVLEKILQPAPQSLPSTSQSVPQFLPSTSKPAPQSLPSTSQPSPQFPPSTSQPAPQFLPSTCQNSKIIDDYLTLPSFQKKKRIEKDHCSITILNNCQTPSSHHFTSHESQAGSGDQGSLWGRCEPGREICSSRRGVAGEAWRRLQCCPREAPVLTFNHAASE